MRNLLIEQQERTAMSAACCRLLAGWSCGSTAGPRDRVRRRWRARPILTGSAAKFDAVKSSSSAYTAVPSTTPSPTDGRQCTNPSVNFGCEYFGVGHYRHRRESARGSTS